MCTIFRNLNVPLSDLFATLSRLLIGKLSWLNLSGKSFKLDSYWMKRGCLTVCKLEGYWKFSWSRLSLLQLVIHKSTRYWTTFICIRLMWLLKYTDNIIVQWTGESTVMFQPGLLHLEMLLVNNEQIWFPSQNICFVLK